MCGIFSIFLKSAFHNKPEAYLENFKEAWCKGKSRGPESSVYNTEYLEDFRTIIGFHRLAINGIDQISNQPIIIDDIVLICNGEIYNYKGLYEELAINKNTIITNSDCEIIIHMYLEYGIEYTLRQLDGVFAFTLYDFRNNNSPIACVARDPYGVRPLFIGSGPDYFGFSSEMKQLHAIDCTDRIQQFSPSTFHEYTFSSSNQWLLTNETRYTTFAFYKQPFIRLHDKTMDNYLLGIRKTFINAVKKRVENCERPIACLLSGGLDSSLVTSIVSKLYPMQVETYSIGLEGSEDLKYAKKVADFLHTKHTELVISEDDFFQAIPEVIQAIESYDTTTVRASVGNYLVAKYISNHSEAKVIFNGDGSDELTGGYLYFHAAPNSMHFDKECMRLLSNIHYFDVLRSDRTISCNGLEPRTPFLDRGWVQYYLSIPSIIRNHNNIYRNIHSIEKVLLRNAFDVESDIDFKPFLPKEILWRKKEAFSDGVSSKSRSWYEIIQEKVELLPEIEYNKSSNIHMQPNTKEQKYYFHLFNRFYQGRDDIIPYYWMPNFIEATDASARTLSIYN